MRLLVATCALVATAATARADKKIVELRPLYVKESAGCEVQASGLARVATGAAALVPTLTGAEHDATAQDAATLAAGLEQVRAYCSDVAAMVTFLADNAKASYRSVEHELDARDNKIRKQRRDIKKRMAELSPITRRLIPRIAGAHTAAPPPVRATPGKFPSGRSVELPALPGAWRISGNTTVDVADYTDKAITASVSARALTGTTCDDQRKQLAGKPTVEGVVDAELPSSTKEHGAAWRITYTRRDQATGPQHHDALCAQHGDTVLLVASMVIPATNDKLAEQLVPVMAALLAAR